MRTLLTILLLLGLLGAAPAVFAQSDADAASSDDDEAAEVQEEGEEADVEDKDNLPDDPLQPDPFDEFDPPDTPQSQRPTRGQRRGRPLELMSRDELASAGFEFGTESDARDTSGALVLSITAGAAIHGLGHFYLGDRRTGWFLLGMEAVSVGMIVTSSAFFAVTEAASPWSALFAPMLQAGVAGFVFSYLADVLGTITRDSGKLAENTAADRGVGFRAQYGLLSAAGLPVRHVIDGRLIADVGGVYGSGATTQDVFLDLASYRGRLGVRPLRGAESLTFLGIEANAEYLQWQGDGEFGRIGADGRLLASYQLGERFGHISEFALGIMAGLGNHWIQIAPRGTTTFEQATSRLVVPFDAWASLNVSPKLNVRGGYGSPELSLVPALHRLLGVAHVAFTYRSSSFGDISLRAEIGDGFALWLGGGLWLGR